MSDCTTTVTNSVRNSAPVGQTSRQAACVQCLHTSEDISHRSTPSSPPAATGRDCSMNATCRQVLAPSMPVLSYEVASKTKPSSGIWFHSLQATSHALHPMQTLVSVKNPIRSAMPVPLQQVERRRAPRPAARPHVAGHRLAFLDVDVGVEHQRHQVVGDVAGDEAAAAPAPVVRQADLVDDAAPDAQRPHPPGDQHPGLDDGAAGDDRGPAAVGQPHLGGELRRHLAEQLRSEEHTSELQSRENLVCRLLLEKKKKQKKNQITSILTHQCILLHSNASL